MPNNLIVNPKALAIILLANAGQEVCGFIVQLPEQLLIEASSRVSNFAIQYGMIAIGQTVVGSKFIDPVAPVQLFAQGIKSLSEARTPEEAISRGTIGAAILICSGVASKDQDASLTFAGFLVVVCQNVLFPGAQTVLSVNLLRISVIKNILVRIVTEIEVEQKRKKLGLPRAKLKLRFNLFRKEKRKKIYF